jgi:hypothetical protein
MERWSNLDDEEATWEEYESLCAQFSYAKLEDKLSLKDGELSCLELAQEGNNMLVVVK